MAKIILGEDRDAGMYIYRTTGVALPRHRLQYLDAVLAASKIAEIFDIGASKRRAAVGFLTDRKTRVLVPRGCAVFTAEIDPKDVRVAAHAREKLDPEVAEFKLGARKRFQIDEFPKCFIPRLRQRYRDELPRILETKRIVYVVKISGDLSDLEEVLRAIG